MQTRFMHTSDWQLGVTRQFLNADSQALWTAARFDGIRNLGRVAKEEGCEFIVVAGDTLDQLSTGAREQMGLLVRLAAASMVSKEGGVPLVLDDALGSTDEGRTQAMGTVLRIASQDLQTIILTCSPERYVHVGAAVSVAL